MSPVTPGSCQENKLELSELELASSLSTSIENEKEAEKIELTPVKTSNKNQPNC